MTEEKLIPGTEAGGILGPSPPCTRCRRSIGRGDWLHGVAQADACMLTTGLAPCRRADVSRGRHRGEQAIGRTRWTRHPGNTVAIAPERAAARCVRRNTSSCEAAFASSTIKQGAQAPGAKAALHRVRRNAQRCRQSDAQRCQRRNALHCRRRRRSVVPPQRAALSAKRRPTSCAGAASRSTAGSADRPPHAAQNPGSTAPVRAGGCADRCPRAARACRRRAAVPATSRWSRRHRDNPAP